MKDFSVIHPGVYCLHSVEEKENGFEIRAKKYYVFTAYVLTEGGSNVLRIRNFTIPSHKRTLISKRNDWCQAFLTHKCFR